MNNSLIQSFISEIEEAQRNLNFTDNDVAELWDTHINCIREWKKGIIDIRYVGALRAAVATLYADKNMEQLDKEIREREESHRKFLGLTGKLEVQDGKLVVKPYPKKPIG